MGANAKASILVWPFRDCAVLPAFGGGIAVQQRQMTSQLGSSGASWSLQVFQLLIYLAVTYTTDSITVISIRTKPWITLGFTLLL